MTPQDFHKLFETRSQTTVTILPCVIVASFFSMSPTPEDYTLHFLIFFRDSMYRSQSDLRVLTGPLKLLLRWGEVVCYKDDGCETHMRNVICDRFLSRSKHSLLVQSADKTVNDEEIYGCHNKGWQIYNDWAELQIFLSKQSNVFAA